MTEVIDAYNNAWRPVGTSDYLTGDAHTVEAMLASMDAGGVDRAVVWSLGPQIYLETSSTELLEVKTAYARVGADKLVYGTDWPATDFALSRAKVQRAISSPSDLAKVEGGNLAALLALRESA